MASTLDVQKLGFTANSRLSNSIGSRKLEFIALLIPTIGVVALNQMVLTTTIADSAQKLGIDLIGLQWYWALENSDVALSSSLHFGELLGLVVGNTGIMGLGTLVMTLSAVDVIHAIALPTLAIKADAIPGRCAVVRITTENTGTFSGQCSELCGSLHGFMPLTFAIAKILK